MKKEFLNDSLDSKSGDIVAKDSCLVCVGKISTNEIMKVNPLVNT